jgi:hypothetical protein
VFLCTDVRSSYRQQVRLAALRASVSYLSSSDAHQLAQSLSLLYPMLDTLPQSHFPKFISTTTPLTTTLFQPHLRPLLGFVQGTSVLVVVFGEWGCGYADLVEDIGYAEWLGKVVE